MRILWTGTFLPFPPVDGGRLVSYHQLEGLARRGHELTVVVPLRRPEDEANVAAIERFATVRAFATRPRSVVATAGAALVSGESLRVERHRLPEAAAAIRHALADASPDVVFVDNLFTAHVVPAVRAAAPRVPIVLLEHNCESQVFSRLAGESFAWRLLAPWESRRVEAAERRALAAVDRVLTLSAADMETLRALSRDTRFDPCGTGIPTRPGEAFPAESGANVVLFLATYLYPPNVDAARWLAESIWPRVRERVPDARLMLAGVDPGGNVAPLANPARGIEAPGFVPDAAAITRSATVAVAPLRVGSGVRLKILEALANERPLVSTTIGAEGLDVTAGEHLLVADDAEAFANAIVHLLENPAAARRIAAAGRARVEKRYSWDAACERLEGILEDVVAGAGATT